LTVSTNTGNNPSGGVGVEPALGLVGLGAPDPATFVVVPIALLPITMAACYIPARRASLIDPIRHCATNSARPCLPGFGHRETGNTAIWCVFFFVR
jgi:hypothetical protein